MKKKLWLKRSVQHVLPAIKPVSKKKLNAAHHPSLKLAHECLGECLAKSKRHSWQTVVCKISYPEKQPQRSTVEGNIKPAAQRQKAQTQGSNPHASKEQQKSKKLFADAI